MELNLPPPLFPSLSGRKYYLLLFGMKEAGKGEKHQGQQSDLGNSPCREPAPPRPQPSRSCNGVSAPGSACSCPSLALVPRSSTTPNAFLLLPVRHLHLERSREPPSHRLSDAPLLPLASTCPVTADQTRTAHFQITAPSPLPAQEISLSAS